MRTRCLGMGMMLADQSDTRAKTREQVMTGRSEAPAGHCSQLFCQVEQLLISVGYTW